MLARFISRGFGLTVFATMMLMSYAAHAENLVWSLSKQYSGVISVSFYSESRNHEWPGGGQVWLLERNQQRYSFNLRCNRGESICFGAWVRGNPDIYWGVGQDRRFSCQKCCHICNGARVQNVNLVYR